MELSSFTANVPRATTPRLKGASDFGGPTCCPCSEAWGAWSDTMGREMGGNLGWGTRFWEFSGESLECFQKGKCISQVGNLGQGHRSPVPHPAAPCGVGHSLPRRGVRCSDVGCRRALAGCCCRAAGESRGPSPSPRRLQKQTEVVNRLGRAADESRGVWEK